MNILMAALSILAVLPATVNSREELVSRVDGGQTLRMVVQSGRSQIVDATWSPDGRHVVTAEGYSPPRVWEASTGAQLLRVVGFADEAGYASHVRYSPGGQWIVATIENEDGPDFTVKMWSAFRGEQLQLYEDGKGPLSASFSPGDSRVVTAALDERPRVWDLKTKKEVLRLVGNTADANPSFAVYSPDGSRILTGSESGHAEIWDARTGQRLQKVALEDDIVTGACYSKDGSKAAIEFGASESVVIIDATTGKKLHQLMVDDGAERTWQGSFHPSDKLFLTLCSDQSIRLWSTETGRELHRLGFAGDVTAAQFSPAGDRIVAVANGSVFVWDYIAANPPHQFSVPADVYTATFSPDGGKILVSCEDETARVFDANTRQELARYEGHSFQVSSATFSRQCDRLLTTSWHLPREPISALQPNQVGELGGLGHIWDLAQAREVIRLVGHEGPITSGEFSPDGQLVVTCGWEGSTRLWDARSGREVRKLIEFDRTYSSSFSSNSRLMVTAQSTNSNLWDTSSQSALRSFPDDLGMNASAILAPDGRSLLIIYGDGSSKMYDTQSGRVLFGIDGLSDEENATCASFEPNGRTIAIGTSSGRVRMITAGTGSQVSVLQPHSTAVRAIAFTREGKRLVTVTAAEVVVWD
ncbi:MAG: hypothetical protein KIT74_01625 [Fimbriimonadales bacterium]|nr:hypothetical protein [Fimbriimonadales bacterium]